MQVLEINNVKELDQVSKVLLSKTKCFRHFLFNAPMGAGKTTLIKQLCEELGVEDHISSPTYSIVNEYLTKDKQSIYHFDLYRLNDDVELLDIGIEEMLESKAICFIEWPEKIVNFLPGNYVKVNIEIEGEKRIFSIEEISN